MQHGHDLEGVDVLDRHAHRVGTVKRVWLDDATGRPTFLAVDLDGFGAGAHLAPASGAVVEETANRIRLPFTTDRIRDAPGAPLGDRLTPDLERDVVLHYRIPTSAEDDPIGRAAAGSSTGHEVTGGVPPRPPRGDEFSGVERDERGVDPRDIE